MPATTLTFMSIGAVFNGHNRPALKFGFVDAFALNNVPFPTAEKDDVDAIEKAINDLDAQTQDFAARRMDNSIKAALKGRSVDNI